MLAYLVGQPRRGGRRERARPIERDQHQLLVQRIALVLLAEAGELVDAPEQASWDARVSMMHLQSSRPR